MYMVRKVVINQLKKQDYQNNCFDFIPGVRPILWINIDKLNRRLRLKLIINSYVTSITGSKIISAIDTESADPDYSSLLPIMGTIKVKYLHPLKINI